MHGASGMDVSMGTVAATAGVAIDPFQSVLGSMASGKILEVVDCGDVLGFSGTEEILLDWIAVVPERNLDGTFEPMDVSIVTRPLIRLVLSHQRQQLLSGPSLGLEVIIVRCRSPSLHHEVN